MIGYAEKLNLYVKQTNKAHKKNMGQFFTPEDIAEWMLRWVLHDNETDEVLDPSWGLGVFHDQLKKIDKEIFFTGYDLDEKILSYRQKGFFELHIEDFIQAKIKQKYKAIVCNPPYLNFRKYEARKQVEYINESYNICLKKSCNLCVLFLIKSINLLAEDGKCCFIMPIEFLNSDYGIEVKKHLVHNKYIHSIYKFNSNVFQGVNTTTIIICCTNSQNLSIDFIDLHNSNIKDSYQTTRKISIDSIDINQKWINYFDSNNEKPYKNLVKLSMFANITRGLVSGANDIFLLNKSRAKLNKIPDLFLTECISNAPQIASNFFTKSDFNQLAETDKNVFLLTLPKVEFSRLDDSIHKYFKLFSDHSFYQNYTFRNKAYWYSIRIPQPAPLLISVFSKNSFKFVRNESNALTLTCFHSLVPINSDNKWIDLIHSYLITPVCESILKNNTRVYGNGLRKFEPSDLSNGLVFNFYLLDRKARNRILKYYYIYKKTGNKEFLNKLNDIYTIELNR